MVRKKLWQKRIMRERKYHSTERIMGGGKYCGRKQL
jgi:hypothetical protein